MDIIYAKSKSQIEQTRMLFREYETFLGINLDFQNFEKELTSLPGKYAPPEGALFIATNNGKAIGCGALRRFGPREKNNCEMKRLFICPGARGMGAGKQLALRLIEEGIALGYATMLLDTLDRLDGAMNLYKSIGFVRTAPYYENPMQDVVYWKMDLKRERHDKPSHF